MSYKSCHCHGFVCCYLFRLCLLELVLLNITSPQDSGSLWTAKEKAETCCAGLQPESEAQFSLLLFQQGYIRRMSGTITRMSMWGWGWGCVVVCVCTCVYVESKLSNIPLHFSPPDVAEQFRKWCHSSKLEAPGHDQAHPLKQKRHLSDTVWKIWHVIHPPLCIYMELNISAFTLLI